MTNPLDLLFRRSTPAKNLIDPAPDAEQLRQIYEIAMYAPDHARLCPYRFITIRGEARYALSHVFEEAARHQNPEADDIHIAKQKDIPLRSPLIVVVVACLSDNPKVPEIEQMLSAGAAAHNILLASNAMGFGSVWVTGDRAYDEYVCQALGLNPDERIIGFIYLGSEKVAMPLRPKTAQLNDKISHWTGVTSA